MDTLRQTHISDNSLKNIFDMHAKNLCLYALHFMQTEADAEDIVQEVFIRFWEKREHQLSDEKVIKTYLFNSVRNACIDRLEKKDVMRYRIDILKQEIAEEETITFDEKLLQEIKQELSLMPDQTQKIITRIFLQNMKYQEVADELDISINTVKTLLRNGVKHLRDRFAKHIELLLFCLKRTFSL